MGVPENDGEALNTDASLVMANIEHTARVGLRLFFDRESAREAKTDMLLTEKEFLGWATAASRRTPFEIAKQHQAKGGAVQQTVDRILGQLLHVARKAIATHGEKRWKDKCEFQNATKKQKMKMKKAEERRRKAVERQVEAQRKIKQMEDERRKE